MSELKRFFLVSRQPGCKFEVLVEAESASVAAIQFCEKHDLQVDILVFEAYDKRPEISWKFDSVNVEAGGPSWEEYAGTEALAALQMTFDQAVRRFIPTCTVKGGLLYCHSFKRPEEEVQA